MHASHDTEGLECRMEMIWNWNTVGSCFLADTWYIRNNGMMAASIIGVALLAAVLELCRRMSMMYDEAITEQFRRNVAASTAADADTSPLKETYQGGGASGPRVVSFRASPLQQLVRAVIHAVTVAVGYILMRIVMSFNGYIILAVFVGAGLGKFLADWRQVHILVYEDGATRAGGRAVGETQPVVGCCD